MSDSLILVREHDNSDNEEDEQIEENQTIQTWGWILIAVGAIVFVASIVLLIVGRRMINRGKAMEIEEQSSGRTLEENRALIAANTQRMREIRRERAERQLNREAEKEYEKLLREI
jgi:flagellar biosynthesis/type III secretory pathway M-ring protein FliF/YscJ